MRVSIIGGGYVGLVQAAIIADLGHDVLCCERDQAKLDVLNTGRIPIYEHGLDEIVARNFAKKRLSYCSELKDAAEFGDVIFICVATPPTDDGSADMTAYWAVFNSLLQFKPERDKIIVNKSTVPVGTARLAQKLADDSSARYHVVSNPEFLRQGCAVHDVYHADRIVIGAKGYAEASAVLELYRDLNRPSFVCDTSSAELIKCASNCFLATKISFINYIAELCEAYGGDVKDVARGIGMDSRIGPSFLNAGIGYGGSCFGKDVEALIHASQAVDVAPEILLAARSVNTNQPRRFVQIIEEALGGLQGKTIALWGLAFKPETDDVRDSRAIEIAHHLIAKGAIVNAHDPVAMKNAALVTQGVCFYECHLEAAHGAHALVVATEWDLYRGTVMSSVKHTMARPAIFDGRNAFDPAELRRDGWEYYGVGRASHRD